MQHGDVQPPTDQFSFGAVFFEMATGIPAFSGEGLTTKIQALADYRDRTYLRNLHRVPWNFRGIVRRCLSWEPSGRYASTAELNRALAQAAKRPTQLWSALAAAALLASAFGVYLSLPKARPLPTLTQITRDGGWTGDVSFDAACGRIVYASDRNAKGKTRIWTSASDGSNPQRQTGEECGAAVRPVFSPDGKAIYYHCADEDREGIYRLDLPSNKTVLVESHADHPSFSPNGDMAFYRANRAFSPLYVWSGGKVRELRKDYTAETTRRPVWSPNGKHLAFLGSPLSTGNALSVNSVEIYVLSLETGEVAQTNLMEQIRKETIYQRKFPLLLRWLEGRLIIGLKSRDNTDLWETAIDPSKPSRTAGLRRLTSSNDEIWSGDACGDRLVFDATDMRWDIGAVPAQSTGIAAGPLEMLTQDAAEDRSPNFGPGGREMLFLSNRDGKFGLYRQSLSAGGGDPGKLFERSGTVDRAQVSPDGSWIAMHQVETAGADRIIAARVDGSEASTICSQCGNLGGWFEDNQAIHAAWEKGPVYQIRKIDRASGQAVPLFEDRERVLGNERIAPGGRWMAFVATSPDWSVWQVFVAPVPVKGVTPSRDWIPVTGPGADELRIGWSPDGRLLYTRGGPARPTELFAQQIDFQTGRLSGPPKSIYRIASDLPGLILYQFVAGEKRVLFQMSQETSNLWSARF
jgi:Tol biopolymer transport system component